MALGLGPERRLVGGELDRLHAARHAAFARHVGADVQDARLRHGCVLAMGRLVVQGSDPSSKARLQPKSGQGVCIAPAV